MAKILVVDDDTNLRQIIIKFLQQGGYETIEARNGKEAIETALFHMPDAIILDVMTPMMDGFTACSKIKADQQIKDIPVILCTAKNRKEDLVQAFKSGASDYIVKPFEKNTILEKIAKVLGGKKPSAAEDANQA